MRPFRCERCGHAVSFEAQTCSRCGAELGYEPDSRSVRELLPTAVAHAFTLHDSGRLHWRCLNAAWGCNGIVLAHTSAVWCRSCALTRGRPDDRRPEPLAAWVEAERAKRRLVHQLDVLGLPVVPRSTAEPHGLAFDFVAIPDAAGVTGHADGVITLDLAEVDDVHRDAIRRQFGERFRSVLGHLRHEVGHHYWRMLVTDDETLSGFREVFGDERVPYATALGAHYAHVGEDWDAEHHVSAYATAHPSEDWAETFAAYLQLVDLVDTAVTHGLVADPDRRMTGGAGALDLDAIGAVWSRLSPVLDALCEAAGDRPRFPSPPNAVVMAKIAFVHRLVGAASLAPAGADAAAGT